VGFFRKTQVVFFGSFFFYNNPGTRRSQRHTGSKAKRRHEIRGVNGLNAAKKNISELKTEHLQHHCQAGVNWLIGK